MSLPRVAIVGRPNVGKSSLLNMLARAKVSIVDPTPGVTRDRVSAVIELDGPLKTEEPKLAEVVDTGGYGVYTAEGARFDDAGEDLSRLTDEIESQIGAALQDADIVLFVIDAQAGITALDDTIAKLLRESGHIGKRGSGGAEIYVVANKIDTSAWEPYAPEASNLGFGEPIPVSAKTNYMRRSFAEKLFEILPASSRRDLDDDPEMKIALVGRRNIGKSSFVNALAGQERCIVSEIAGTTRDAIDVRFEFDGKTCLAIDTAGVRKRTHFADQVEYWAFHRCQLAINRSDVVLMLIDATDKVAATDKKLGNQIAEEYKPCVIVITKWDLTEGRKTTKGVEVTTEDYQKYIEKELPGLAHCPIIFTSASEETGLRESVEIAFDLFEQSRQRLGTSKLNKVLQTILDSRGPTSRLGREAKILYASQVTTSPPTIVMVVNDPKLFHGQYERYLLNRFRELTPFAEIPVRLLFRQRKRADLADLLSGKHRADQRARKGSGASDLVVEGDEDFAIEGEID